MASRVAIIEAKRTPIGKFLGAFVDYSAVSLGTHVARTVLESAGVEPGDVDEVYFGQARQAGSGPNPARQVSFNAGLGYEVPAHTINSACGSGIKSVALGADAITAGRARVILAGGMENMSRMPFMLDRARTGYRLGHAPLLDGMYTDGFVCRLCDMVMGETAEVLADEYHIGREEQDEWALMSQHRAQRAREQGLFDEEITPVTLTDRKGRETVVAADEHVRDNVTMEALAKLPPVFSKTGTVTAGNASGITDGASAVVLTTESDAKAAGLEPLGYVRDFVVKGVDPKRMGIGPVPSMRALLERNGLALTDIPVIELNEAFAAQVIACQRELEFDPDRVNRNGGSIALGHPIGNTGARILVTLLHEMKRKQFDVGVATLCVSGGMGMSMLIDRT